MNKTIASVVVLSSMLISGLTITAVPQQAFADECYWYEVNGEWVCRTTPPPRKTAPGSQKPKPGQKEIIKDPINFCDSLGGWMSKKCRGGGR